MNGCMDIFVGIDPGKRGALVAVGSGAVVHQARMPWLGGAGIDAPGLVAELLEVRALGRVRVCAVERAQAMPKQGVSSMFRYGRDYGVVLGVLAALQVPHVTVSPRRWQGSICGGRGGAPKARAILVAGRRLPGLDMLPGRCRRPHDGIADAACLALYAHELAPR